MTLVRVTLTEDAPSSGFPFELPAVRSLPLDVRGNVTVIVGDNGTGKSTLVEAVAVAAGFNPEGGSGQVRFQTTATHSELGEHLRLLWTDRLEPGWFLRAESFYNVASFRQANPGGFAERSYHEMSHGESFVDVARTWFDNRRLFILDEPEAALPFKGQLSLIAGVLAGVEVGAVHRCNALAVADGHTWSPAVRVGRSRVTNRSYDELEVVAQWRSFLDAPDRFLRYLH